MAFTSVSYRGFRNICDGTVDLDAPELFFIGGNGQGKTNLLESIYLLSYGSSFRTRRTAEIIANGENEMVLYAKLRTTPEYGSSVSLKADRRGGKEIRFDGKRLGDRTELVSRIPCIAFTHDDLSIVDGPPDARRRFCNQTGALIDPRVIPLLHRYRKVLGTRNEAVKRGEVRLLDVIDQQLVETGVEIQRQRASVVEGLNEVLGPAFVAITGPGDPVIVEYRPSWRDAERQDAIARLEATRERDLVAKTTTTGPHRDRLRFIRGNRDFSEQGSTGQKRLASLILRVAQATFVNERIERNPILLLDDVLLELDGRKREAFFAHLPAYEQALFTFLPEEPFERYRREGSRRYDVSEGTVA